jgi:lipoprotein-anchoring transpeptidase ErfK/SrfK
MSMVRRNRRKPVALVALALAGVVLTGCTTSTANSGAGSTTTGSTASSPAAKPLSVSISPAGTAPVAPANPIVVTAANGRLGAVTVTDTATNTPITGTSSPDRTTWTSNQQLGYGATYQVAATGIGADGHSVSQSATLHTVTPAAQTYPSLVPAPAAGSDFGVGQVIEVLFDHTVTDKAAAEKALTVTSTPSQPGGWYWISSKEVHYRPENYWQPGTTVNVNIGVYGVDLGGGVYGKASRTMTLHIHDSWVAKADGHTEKMQIFHNDQLVNTMDISLGSPGKPTHEGVHVISQKSPSVVMDSCTYGVCPGEPGYYKETVLLDERISNDGEFVHSAPWSVGSQGSTNVSHGCVNLSPANAQWFYSHFNPGDVVDISNSGGKTLPVWDTYGDWELSWDQYRAGSALNG